MTALARSHARRRVAQPATPATLRGPQRERHEPDYLLLFAIVTLAALGILMVYSSSGVTSLINTNDPFAVVGPQAVWGAIGLVVMVVMMRLDFRWLRLVSVPSLIIAIGLLIVVLLPPIGPLRPIEVGGSARWLQFGPLPAMHPAEFAKLALVIYLAHWLARNERKVGSFVHGMLPFLLIVGPLLALVLKEPDLGTTGVLTLTAFTMFFVAGASVWQLVAIVPVGAAGLWYAINSTSYQMDRIRSFLDPWADPLGSGYHAIQGLLSLGIGGLLGTGLGGNNLPNVPELPNATNDFVFALVGQELGFFAAVGVILLYLLLAWRGLRIALHTPDRFGRLLATGITAWLTFQAFINVAVVVVLLPVTGITLPFVSAGGSSLAVSFAAVGILLSISRETLPRGTWSNADSDSRRGYGRSRLPRAGRRPFAARSDA
jgi:cell division protein FtsW